MLETGVDIVEVGRFDRLVSNDAFLKKYFHPAEIAYVHGSARPAQHLAVRFAAKEAVRKVLLSRVDKLSWKESWIRNGPYGKPLLYLSDRVTKEAGIRHASVSLSHTAGTAIAVVVIEMDGEETAPDRKNDNL